MSITRAKPITSPDNGPLFVGQSTSGPGNPDDFVEDVLAQIATIIPGFGGDAMARAGAAIRERWGGDRPYIARRAGEGRSARNQAIRRDYLAGERFELLERRYQLTRRRLLQIVKE